MPFATSTVELKNVLTQAGEKYPEYRSALSAIIEELGDESYPIQHALLCLVLTNPKISADLVQEAPKEEAFDVEARSKIFFDGILAIVTGSLISKKSKEETIELLKKAADKTYDSPAVDILGEEITRLSDKGAETVLKITIVVGGVKYDLETGISGYDVFANLVTLNEHFGKWVYAKELRPNSDTAPFIYNPNFLISNESAQKDAHIISHKHGVHAFLSYANSQFRRASVPLMIEPLEHGTTVVCYRLVTDPNVNQRVEDAPAETVETNKQAVNPVV